MIAVDTNVLVYARREEFPKHERAVAAMTRLAEGDRAWGIPIFCVVEFVRVVTHPRLFEPPTEPKAAVEFVSALLESPSARLFQPNSRFLAALAAILAGGGTRGNHVFDAAIAALCTSSGVSEILTNDPDFGRYGDLHPVSLDEFADS